MGRLELLTGKLVRAVLRGRGDGNITLLPDQFVKRQSPPRGKPTLYLFPAKSAQQTIRNKLKYLTARRAPISPQEFGAKVNPLVTGWVNSFRHTNARQAFRGLQRCVNIRFRRSLTQRSKGRGFGWTRYPTRKLYAMGLAYIRSGQLEYVTKPAHDGRRRLSDRRIREI